MKNSKNRLLLTVLILTLAALSAAYGQNTPTDDAYTNTASPGTNYGGATALSVVSPSDTAYIIFDLSSIPSGYTGANVAKATLKLYVNTVTTAGSFNVDYVNGTWSEKSITANLAPALGATVAASVPLGKGNVHDYIVVDVTAAVASWLDGVANDGLAIVGNSPLSASFDSKENTSNSHPPELDIVLTGNGTGTITGVTPGPGLVGGGTSGNVSLSLPITCPNLSVLQWTGSTWACSSVGAGTITGVTAGTDLTGGGTGGNVTLNLDTTKIPQLNAANSFTGNQTVNGHLTMMGSSVDQLLNVVQQGSGTAIYGFATATSGVNFGVSGASSSNSGVGVSGEGGTGILGIGYSVGGSFTLAGNTGYILQGMNKSGTTLFYVDSGGNQSNAGNLFANGYITANGPIMAHGNGQLAILGDPGCGGGFVGIGFGALSGCNNYSMIGNGQDTFINRPAGGTLHFRENNNDQITVVPGGNVGIARTISSYNGIATHGNGVSSIVATLAQPLSPSQQGNLALYTPPSSGLFRVSLYWICTGSTSTQVFMFLRTYYTDFNGNQNAQQTPSVFSTVNVDCGAAGNYLNDSFPIWATGGSPIYVNLESVPPATTELIVTLEQLM